MSTKTSSRTMYMHTLDGKPASFFDLHGVQALTFASNGHTSRAAKLVPSLGQIRAEQQACIKCDRRLSSELQRSFLKRYGYVLVRRS